MVILVVIILDWGLDCWFEDCICQIIDNVLMVVQVYLQEYVRVLWGDLIVMINDIDCVKNVYDFEFFWFDQFFVIQVLLCGIVVVFILMESGQVVICVVFNLDIIVLMLLVDSLFRV